MKRIKTDVCVIGAGSGGLSVAAGAVQMGARVVLIEGHKMGGDCLNYGCVPSKALIASARRAAAMRETGNLGVTAVTPGIDFAAAKDRVARVIETIVPIDNQDRFEKLGCTVIRDRARHLAERGAGGRDGCRGAALRSGHWLATVGAADRGA